MENPAPNDASLNKDDSALRALEDLARTGNIPQDGASAAASTQTVPVPDFSPPSSTAPATSLQLPDAIPPPVAAPESRAAPGEPQVAQIQILGLKIMLESQVRDLLKVREWTPYPDEILSQDVSALLKSGWFTAATIRKVVLSTTSMRVDVNVTEGTPRREYTAPQPTETDAAAAALGAAEPELPPAPWVLGEVAIRGNRNIKTGVIRGEIGGRKGDLYDRPDHDRDVRKVLALGGFERVVTEIDVLKDRQIPAYYSQASKSPHPIRLTFVVEEKPIISSIVLAGRDKIGKGAIKDELTMREKDPFDRSKLAADAEKILALYKKRGYHHASVGTGVDIDSAAFKAVVTYTIVEGPNFRIGEIRLSGVKAFKPKKLLKQMENRPKRFLRSGQYKPDEFPEDIKKIERFYKNRGFSDFEIKSSSVVFDDATRRILIDIVLEEGREYRFGDTTFSGHAIYASSELAKAIEYRRGKIFNQEKFELSLQGMRELYAEKGRLHARISPERAFDEKTQLTNVHLDIAEGNTVYVDHVDIEGNKATKTYVFRRELVIKPGMPFSLSKIKKSQQRIRNLGFIDDVGLDVQSPFDQDLVDLTFDIFEGKPGMLSAGAGFSSLDGLVGTLSMQHLNLLGRAYRASVQWSFGSRVNDFSVGWSTPWVKDRPITLGFDAFSTRRISPFEGSASAFTHKRTGGSVRVGPRFQDDKYHLNTSYTFQKIQVANVQNQFSSTLSEGTSASSFVSVEVARDTRDNIWDPGSGTRHSIGTSYSGGVLQGDIHFFKPFLQNTAHKTLFSINDYPLVLSGSNRISYVTPFGETREVPIFERFFIGGQDTLRGYSSFGEVGARNGGKVYDVFNVELGLPLLRERKSTIVKFVTFFDAGSTWENVRSMQFRIGTRERDIKTNVGFGIRFVTPAFPIRLDWGYGFQHRPGEELTQINFGIGSLF